jgi:glycosyltransferase involved in cell wall biosynthesis
MNVAIFVHCFFPDHFYGTETYTYNIAKNLQALGHEVTVVSANFYGEPQYDQEVTDTFFDDIRVISVDKNKHPNQRVADTYYQSSMEQPLRHILQMIRPDIIHVTHLINHTAVLLKVIDDLKIPAVATFTDFYGFCFNCKLEDANGKLCSGPNKDRSNCLACYLKVAGSQHQTSPFLRWCRKRLPISMLARIVNLAKRYRLPLPVDIKNVSIDLQRRPLILEEHYKSYRAVIAPTTFLRKAYLNNRITTTMHTMWFGVDTNRDPKPIRVDDAPLRIGYIGQIAAHKGVDLLIEAFINLGHCNAELVIYGPLDQDLTYADRLLKQSKGYPIRFEATFASEKMAQVLGGMDLLAIPSRWYENSPLVLLNALASHTPVIVSNVEGLTEFVDEGVNGFSFKRSDAIDLNKVLKRFIKNPKLAAEMSRLTRFERTTLEMTKDVLQIYKANAKGKTASEIA